MTSFVKKNKNYIALLLEEEVTISQKRCLVATANTSQLNSIAEVVHNVFDGLGKNAKLRKDFRIAW